MKKMTISSFIRRNIFIPLNVLKDRSPRLSYLKYLENSQYTTLEELKLIQFESLKNIISYSYNNTIYYRERFDALKINPLDIKSEDDYRKLPILTKNDIQDNPSSIISKDKNRENLIAFKTGGSTGKSVVVYKDFNTMELEVGSALRSFKWTGWMLGEPWGRIWGNPPNKKTVREILRDVFLEPQIFLDTMSLTDESMWAFVEEWRRIRPSIMHGHSHSIYIFSQFCKKNHIKRIRPKGIISTSMMLMPNERYEIESVFDCSVTNLYGCEEVGLIACECEEHNGMHMNIENLYIEIIDQNGNIVDYEKEGSIVVTSLINHSMPLIRYKIEDIGILSHRTCPCGRSLPILERVVGRTADFLVRNDGSLVACVSLVERTLTAIPGILQMQIIQEELDTIIIKIVRSSSFSDRSRTELVTEIRNTMGNNISINIQYVDRIDRDKNGKYRFSISKVNNPYL